MFASGVRLGTGGAGEDDRGVEAGTGVLGGYGVFVGSAMLAQEFEAGFATKRPSAAQC